MDLFSSLQKVEDVIISQSRQRPKHTRYWSRTCSFQRRGLVFVPWKLKTLKEPWWQTILLFKCSCLKAVKAKGSIKSFSNIEGHHIPDSALFCSFTSKAHLKKMSWIFQLSAISCLHRKQPFVFDFGQNALLSLQTGSGKYWLDA